MLLATSAYVAKSQPEKRPKKKERSEWEVLSDATNCGVGWGAERIIARIAHRSP